MVRYDCPACESAATRQLLSRPYSHPDLAAYLTRVYDLSESDLAPLERLSFIVSECRACGLLFQAHAPDADLMTTIYESWIKAEIARPLDLERPLDGYASLVQDLFGLRRHFEATGVRNIKALDYGMGYGGWARLARGLGIDAYGYEISPSRITYAASMGIPIMETLPDAYFHLVNLDQVLEHVTKPREVLADAVRTLIPGGIIKIGVPNATGLRRQLMRSGTIALLEQRFNAIAPLEHLNAFTPQALRSMCESLELEICKGPFRKQFGLVWASTPKAALKSLARPLVRSFLPSASIVMRRPTEARPPAFQ